ncbi:MAG: hypothetical protein JWN39_4173 [Ilumatobacteraceae bacterium]|nr:hypothetical protein [Ilumatobacteraceae bacterium]
MPWATLDPAVGSTTRIRAGTVGLVLAALATGVVALSWWSTKRGATLPGRISVALGGSAAVVSIVLALRAMSTANGLATAGPSATSYAIGSGLAVVASLTVVAVTVARSTH